MSIKLHIAPLKKEKPLIKNIPVLQVCYDFFLPLEIKSRSECILYP